MKSGIALLLILACHGGCRSQTTEATGYIGSHRLTFKAQAVAKEGKFTVKGPAEYLAVTEVYPDTPEEVVYKYRISGSGIGSYERCFRSQGFGPTTYFLRVRNGQLGTIKVTNHSNGSKSRPVLISGLRAVKESEIKSLLEWDKFTLVGEVPEGTMAERDTWLAQLASGITPRAEDRINLGFSSEIRFANQDKPAIKQQLVGCVELAKKHKLPAVLGMVSWGAGAPVSADDGQGGTFGDLTYRQIQYAPDADLSENVDLEKLLGDAYTRHYGPSPSDTPCLTLNSPALRRYTAKRFDEAVGLLKDASGGDSAWIRGILLENEPGYSGSQTKPPVWSDFNPLVIADAKNDGVDLDPTDGLSDVELAWLQRNVGEFNQQAVDAAVKSLAAHKFTQSVPIYAHAVVSAGSFPGATIGHSGSEWSYSTGARVGLQDASCQVSDLCRVRDWGPWSITGGRAGAVASRLWDLRAAYMLGADLFISRDWYAIGAQKFFDHVKEFLTQLPEVSLPPAEARLVDKASLKIKAPVALQAFDRVEIPVNVTKKVTGAAFIGLVSDDGRGCTSQQQPVSLTPGMCTLTIDFATPAECSCSKEALLVLYVFDSKGKLVLNSVGFTEDSAKGVKLALNLRTQRALSLSVTTRRSQ